MDILKKKPISRKDMIAYLTNHFRYDTIGSWNNATSYAQNVKLCRLRFPSKEVEDRAYELLDMEEAFDEAREILHDFDERHHYVWQIGQNGRSGGYYVLYKGGIEKTGYKSRCTKCGQLNFKSLAESGTRCGKCGEESRADLTSPVYRSYTHPGLGVDMGENFEEWDTSSLESRVEIVWDFDKTVERAVNAFITFATENRAEEEEIMVPKTIKVAVPVE